MDKLLHIPLNYSLDDFKPVCSDKEIKTESFLDKDKLILIFYLTIGNSVNRETAIILFNEIKNELEKTFDNSVKTIFIPVRDQPSHVEAFSMNQVESIRFEEINSKIEKVMENLIEKKNGGYCD